MLSLLSQNWKAAVSEVLASIVGTIGIILLIAFILSGQSEETNPLIYFHKYFSGGQIGLSILSLSGVVFVALMRHGRFNPLLSFLLYVLFLLPIFFTAIIIGINPGFKDGVIKPTNLSLLWFSFFGLHLLWFVTLVLEPVIPSAEEAGKMQDTRVHHMAEEARQRQTHEPK